MSVAAYRQSVRDTLSPREVELKVFQQVTADLEACRGPITMDAVRAVGRNRQLWHVLLSDLSQPDNVLPDSLKAGLISLGLWVDRYSGQVLNEDRPLAPLIDVNRTVMQGLARRDAAVASPG